MVCLDSHVVLMKDMLRILWWYLFDQLFWAIDMLIIPYLRK